MSVELEPNTQLGFHRKAPRTASLKTANWLAKARHTPVLTLCFLYLLVQLHDAVL